MFEDYPTYGRYRALYLTDPMLVGEDCYALQLGLNEVGDYDNPLPADGVLGRKTSKAIIAVQKKLKVVADGVAGQRTQRAIGERLCSVHDDKFPDGLPWGQVAHESSFLLGNYSPYRPLTNSYDAGLCQRNTQHTEPKICFDPVKSVETLVDRVLTHYDKFKGLASRRRWELAAGSWNAPAYACYFARKEGATGVLAIEIAVPGGVAAAAFEGYVNSATAYLEVG